MEQRTVVILGKPGSGKDTQAKLLTENLNPSMMVKTGDLVRELSKRPTLLGRRVEQVYNEGGLLPEWLAAFLWQRELAAKFEGTEHLVFSSSPRRLGEAKELDSVMDWLGRSRAEAVVLNIPDEEAVTRIVKRGRDAEDSKDIVRARLREFTEHTKPVIDYYKDDDRLHIVNGVGSVEDIHARVLDALGFSGPDDKH